MEIMNIGLPSKRLELRFIPIILAVFFSVQCNSEILDESTDHIVKNDKKNANLFFKSLNLLTLNPLGSLRKDDLTNKYITFKRDKSEIKLELYSNEDVLYSLSFFKREGYYVGHKVEYDEGQEEIKNTFIIGIGKEFSIKYISSASQNQGTICFFDQKKILFIEGLKKHSESDLLEFFSKYSNIDELLKSFEINKGVSIHGWIINNIDSDQELGLTFVSKDFDSIKMEYEKIKVINSKNFDLFWDFHFSLFYGDVIFQ